MEKGKIMSKKTHLLLFLFLISAPVSIFTKEQPLPNLLKVDFTKQEIHKWCWRISEDNSIYPFLQMKSDEIEFLSPNGEVTCRYEYLPHSTLVSSTKQNYIAFIKRINTTQQIDVNSNRKFFEYNVTTFSGEKIFSIPLNLFYDDPIPALYLTDEGSAILVDATTGLVQLYMPNGDLAYEIDLFDDDIIALEKPIDCAVSTKGDIFVIAAQKRPMTFNDRTTKFISGEPGLFCFSLEGEKLWEIQLELLTVSSVSVSPAGKFIIVSHYSPNNESLPILRSTVFDINGNKIITIPAMFNHVSFSGNKNQVFFTDRENLYNVDLIGKDYQKINILDKVNGRLITDLKLSGSEHNPVLLISRPVFQDERFVFIEPELLKLNSNGKRIWNIYMGEDKIIEPSIFIHNNNIGVGSLSNVKIYGGEDEE